MGGIDLGFGIVGGRHRPLHVGLSRADPDFADEDIVDDDGFTIPFDDELMRSTGGQRRQPQTPGAVSADVGLSRHASQRHCDRLLWRRPTPDHDRLRTLYHHVVGEQCRQAKVGVRRQGREESCCYQRQ